jgi:transcriptional regulator with XRE-family HTH domain
MTGSPPGVLLRDWRTRRRFSQLDLALLADVSAKHLSYVETGRSKPSPEMIVHLCEHLDVPLRSRNDILLAAGFAPRYRHLPADAPAAREGRDAVERLIATHASPTIVVDRDWNLVTANAAAAVFLTWVAPHLLEPPTNVIRLSLHNDGLAPRIANLGEYATHVLARVRRAIAASPSPALEGLLDEFAHVANAPLPTDDGLFLTLDVDTDAGLVRLFSTITVFGSPRDVGLSELALETFHPADDVSRERLDRLIAAA